MFSSLSKKGHGGLDVKKCTLKVLDTKKDSSTRLKHLRTILENVDVCEAKSIFETHYSLIYYLFYDVFSTAEANNKVKLQRIQRDDVECVLFILESILTLLPEILHQRWQLHSITRVMHTLLHPANILRLRREAIRLFVMWYQILGEQCGDEVTVMFATLVPGFPVPLSHCHTTSAFSACALVANDNTDELQVNRADYVPILTPQSVEKTPSDLTRFFLECFMDNIVTQLTRIEWREKWRAAACFRFLLDSFKQFYLPHIFPNFNWHTNVYAPSLVLPELRRRDESGASSPSTIDASNSSLSGDDNNCERQRIQSGNPTNNAAAAMYASCRLVVVKWVANFCLPPPEAVSVATSRRATSTGTAHTSTSRMPSVSGGSGDDASVGGTPELRRAMTTRDCEHSEQLHSLESDSSCNTLFTVDSRDRVDRVDVRMDECWLVHDVLFGSRQNVNFVCEILRQAFTMDSNCMGAVKRAILVYKDWIQMTSTVPLFLMEPSISENTLNYAGNTSSNHSSQECMSECVYSSHRDRASESSMFYGSSQPTSSNTNIRAGLQNTLQLFITHSCCVFLPRTPFSATDRLATSATSATSAGFSQLVLQQQLQQCVEDQVELCKRVLNLYRYLVMNITMNQRTWDQLLRVLLHVTSSTLSCDPTSTSSSAAAAASSLAGPSGEMTSESLSHGVSAATNTDTNTRHSSAELTMATVLARPLFQTLLVTWVKACLNVVVSAELWNSLLQVLSSLTHWSELIKEWAKTLETLTRVLARQLYDLDVNNLPLDRLSEQKTKRRRGKQQLLQDNSSHWSQTADSCDSYRTHSVNMAPSTVRSSLPPQTSTAGERTLGVSRCADYSRGTFSPSALAQSRTQQTQGRIQLQAPIETHMCGRGGTRLVRCLSDTSLASFALAPTSTAPAFAPVAAVNLLAGARAGTAEAGAKSAPRQSMGESTQHRRLSRSIDSLFIQEGVCASSSLAARAVDVVERECESTTLPSRSVSPSSCLLESGAVLMTVKHSTLHADNNSIDTLDSGSSVTEYRSVMSGGCVRGWTADVACTLWRRMLAALGNINDISQPHVHAHVFDHLIELARTLLKIEANLGVSVECNGGVGGGSGDNLNCWPPPSPPPLSSLLPWCLEALQLPASHAAGQQRALELLCLLMVRRRPPPLTNSTATALVESQVMFLHAVHVTLASGSSAAVTTLIRHCGAEFMALHLPASTLLALDFLAACQRVTTSSEIRGVPRVEAVSILGGMVCFGRRWPNLEALQSDTTDLNTVPCSDLKHMVVSALLRAGRREPSVMARCTALVSLAVYLHNEFSHPLLASSSSSSISSSFSGGDVATDTQTDSCLQEKVTRDAVFILLSALKCTNRSVAVVAVSLLVSLTAHSTILLRFLPELPRRIIEVLCSTLENLFTVTNSGNAGNSGNGGRWRLHRSEDSSLARALCHAIAEWCMVMPLNVIAESSTNISAGSSLLTRVLQVLESVSCGRNVAGMSTEHTTEPVTTATTTIPSGTSQHSHLRRCLTENDGVLDEGSSGSQTSAPAGTTSRPRSFTSSRAVSSSVTADISSRTEHPRTPTQLSAFAMMCHLTTHLGHFPMLTGAVPLGCVVSEQDDLSPDTSSSRLSSQLSSTSAQTQQSELSADIFQAANVQMFVLNNSCLLSLVQLPAEAQSDGKNSASPQVRIILRDITGKFCWDASLLTDSQHHVESVEELSVDGASPHSACDRINSDNHTHQQADDLIDGGGGCVGVAVTSVVVPPRRHRPVHCLPSHDNTEPGMDNLDDLVRHILHTSPECCTSGDISGASSGEAILALMGRQRMADTINVLLCQRNAEEDALIVAEHPPASNSVCASVYEDIDQASSTTTVECGIVNSASTVCDEDDRFHLARLLFSQLGLASWHNKRHVHLLKRSDQTLRQIRHLDNQRCRETHKIAVIYVAPGQEDKRAILSNISASLGFEQFVTSMAWEVELESHAGFLGGLQRNGSSGLTAPYYADSFTEVMFHVSTRMPSNSAETLLQKTRHLGNDEVHIVWSEHDRDYRRSMIATEFCDVLIVIYPLPANMFRIQISRKPEVPFFGPLFDGAIVSVHALPVLVRTTAVAASRAKRTMLPHYLTYYEERQKSLNDLLTSHKENASFEQFMARVYRPVPHDSHTHNNTTKRPPKDFSDGVNCNVRFDVPATDYMLGASISDSGAVSDGNRVHSHIDFSGGGKVEETEGQWAEFDCIRSESGSIGISTGGICLDANISCTTSDPSPKTVKRLSFKTSVRKASTSIQETIVARTQRATNAANTTEACNS